MNVVERSKPSMARNVRRLGHLDLPGAGQVYVDGKYAYVGHITNKEGPRHHHPRHFRPEQAARGRDHHARRPDLAQPQGARDRRHHDRQHERNMTAIGRKADELPQLREGAARRARAARRRTRSSPNGSASSEPTWPRSRREEKRATTGRLQDLRRVRPREAEAITHHKTDGIGVHRFDMDATLRLHLDRDAGLHRQHPRHLRHPQSGEARGSVALVAAGPAPRGRREADLARPPAPPASRAALRRRAVGRLLARRRAHRRRLRHPQAAHRSAPTTTTRRSRSRRTPSCRCRSRSTAGASRSRSTRKTTRTAPRKMAERRGRPHACLWVFDVTDPAEHQAARAVSEVSELDSPWSRARPAPLRRAPVPGAHERRHARLTAPGSRGGLRIVDIADPLAPREVGYYIPEPAGGRAAPQTNDVDVDERGLVYIVDRYVGFDTLEFRPSGAA